MEFFVTTTEFRDIRQRGHAILWGRDSSGNQACVICPFTPFFFIAIPHASRINETAQKAFMRRLVDDLKCNTRLTRVVSRIPFVGFTNKQPVPMVQVVFDSYKAWKNAKYRCKDKGYQTYEGNLDPMLKFFHVADMDPVGWIRLANPHPSPNIIARDGIQEYRLDHYSDIQRSDSTSVPKLVIASWDIECVSGTGGFPDSSIMSDKIITIGTSYMVYGEDMPCKRTVHQLGTCKSLENADVYTYDTESDLINAWIRELGSMGTDVLVGYNIWGFDSKYIDGRASTLIDFRTGDSAVDVSYFGKSKEGGGEVIQKNLSSSAYGQNTYFYHATPGVIQLDLLMIYRKELKLESYTLDNVCRTYLGDMTKIDLKPHEIFECFKDEGPEGRTKIAEYCVRDCDLPLMLINKLNTFTNQLEMAKVVCVPIEYLNTRGQQIRCYSQICRMTRTTGFAIQDMEKGKQTDAKYVGATVLDPVKGAYMNDIVSGLDFASLYPSIMRAHTMCPSTIVLDESMKGIDGIEYYDIETTPGHVVTFAQDPTAIVPTLLANLATWRKKSKRDMADAKKRGDSFAASIHNAKQLSYKVSMNSIYGFFGATVGMIPLIDLASAVTATGRQMIYHTKKYCEEHGHKVVYGDTDSVMTILNLGEENRLNRALHMQKAKELADEITKTFKAPNELEYEKIYTPYLIFSKKRYAALMYENDPEKPSYIDVKGLQLVRRDNAPIVRDISKQVLDILMYERSFSKALSYTKKEILRVLRHEYPWEKFIVSKSLRTGYKNPDALPHVVVAEKRRQRGNPPSSGERVPYVFVIDQLKSDLLQSQRAEDPDYAREHGMQLDTLYYIRNQILSPVTTLLDLEYTTSSSMIMDDPEIQALILSLQAEESKNIKEAKRVRFVKEKNLREITDFFKKC